MKFSPDFIDKVQQSHDLVELISQYTELRGNGRQLIGRCPFPDHNDHGPSFSVSSEKQLYHCFGCKKSGNIFTFLRDIQGLGFVESVKILAERASIPLPEGSQSEHEHKKNELRKNLLKINEIARKWFQTQLHASVGKTAMVYLKKRGLASATIERFHIGYAPESWELLSQKLLKENVPLTLAEQLGLVKKRTQAPDRGNSYYDAFRNRIIFPIMTPQGETLGFGARTLSLDSQTPKYINSPESPLFHKSRTLYGLHASAPTIRSRDKALIVEGYIDAVSVFQAGFPNVAAVMGTALTEGHARLLARMTNQILLLFDGDEAGLDGAEKSLNELLRHGLFVKGLLFEDGQDPDEVIRKEGPKDFSDRLQQAKDLFIELLHRRWMYSYQGSPSEKVQIITRLAPLLNGISLPKLQDLYITELARQLDVQNSWIRKALKSEPQKADMSLKSLSFLKSPKTTRKPPDIPQCEHKADISVKDAPHDEVLILSLLLHSESLFVEFFDNEKAYLVEEWLSHPGLRSLWEIAKTFYRQRPDQFATIYPLMSARVDHPEKLVAAFTEDLGNWGEDLAEKDEVYLLERCIDTLRKRRLKEQAQSLVNELKKKSSDEVLRKFMELQKSRIESLKSPNR